MSDQFRAFVQWLLSQTEDLTEEKLLQRKEQIALEKRKLEIVICPRGEVTAETTPERKKLLCEVCRQRYLNRWEQCRRLRQEGMAKGFLEGRKS